MTTGRECLQCLLRRAVAAAHLATDDQGRRRLAVVAALHELGGIQPDRSPADFAYGAHISVACMTLRRHPCCNIEAGSHECAPPLLPAVADTVSDAEDPLLAAAGVAVAANIADAGMDPSLDIQVGARAATSRPSGAGVRRTASSWSARLDRMRRD